MRATSLARLLLPVALSTGCLSGQFTGDDGNIRFQSNYGTEWRDWTPAIAVAAGAPFQMDAVDVTARDPTVESAPRPPRAQPTVLDEGGALVDVALAEDSITAVTGAPGQVTITWDGDVDDRFTVRVEQAAAGRFVDPVREAALALGLVDQERIDTGELGPDLQSPLVLPPGARLSVGARLLDATGGELATDASLYAVTSADGLELATAGTLTTITAPSTAGDSGVVDLAHAGVDVGVLEVIAADPADVAAIELALVDNIAAVKATVRLADGSVLWQPPIVWELGPGIVETDQAELGEQLAGSPFDPERTDLMLVERASDDGRPLEAEVVARIGDVEARVLVPFAGSPPSPPPAPVPLPEPVPLLSCGDCGAAGPGAPLGVAIFAVLRRGRRANAPARSGR